MVVTMVMAGMGMVMAMVTEGEVQVIMRLLRIMESRTRLSENGGIILCSGSDFCDSY